MIDQVVVLLAVGGASITALGLLALTLSPILDDIREDRCVADVRRITAAWTHTHRYGTAPGSSAQIARWTADTQTHDMAALRELLDKQDAAGAS